MSVAGPPPLAFFLAEDRRRALARGAALPEREQSVVLLADLTDFTGLAADLVQQRGQEGGAEAVMGLLNAIYGAVLDPVQALGGSAVAFSGDAVLCRLPPSRASLSLALAAEMQAALAALTPPGGADDAGRSLRMKIAITRGETLRGAVGDPALQRFDVLAGPPVVRAGQLLERAASGEIRVDEAVRRSLRELAKAPADQAVNLDPARRSALRAELAAAASRPPEVDPLDVLPAEASAPWLPAPLRARLAQSPPAFLAELRTTAALFVDLVGFEGATGPEGVGPLDAWVRGVQGLLADLEGSLVQVTLGDKGGYLYAVFGAFRALREPAVRAAQAALWLRGMAHADPDLDVPRMGLGVGRMFVGAYGGERRWTIGAFGEETNFAARRMQHVGPGDVGVTRAAASALRGRYRFLPASDGLEPNRILAAPARLALDLSSAQPQARVEGDEAAASLLGREPEMRQLQEEVAALGEGRGGLLLLRGVPGLGKSRILAEIARSALGAGARVLRARGHPAARSQPYRAIDQALWAEQRPALSGLRTELAGKALLSEYAFLKELFGLGSASLQSSGLHPPEGHRELYYARFVSFLRDHGPGPLCLLVDDAHWLDPASIELLGALHERGTGLPFLLVLASRLQTPDPLHALVSDPGVTTLQLDPLSEPAMQALVTGDLDGEVEETAACLIARRAQGNPFFARELTALARDSGALQRRDGIWRLSEDTARALRVAGALTRDLETGAWRLGDEASLPPGALALPDSARGVVLARRERLDASEALTLKAASVLGQGSVTALRRTHPSAPGGDELRADLDALEAAGWLARDDGRWAFSHDLPRETLYDSLPGEQRRRLHALAARALEEEGADDAVLALHFERAEIPDRAVHYLARALRNARARDANETALDLLRRLLRLEDAPTWRQAEVEITLLLGRPTEAEASLERLEGMAGASRLETALLWARLHESTGNYEAALAALSRAEGVAWESSSAEPRARCALLRGTLARRRGDFAVAAEAFRQARGLTGDEVLAHEALDGEAVALREMGELSAALALHERSLELARSAGDLRAEAEARNHLGVTAFLEHDLEAAAEHHRRALELRRRIGDLPGEGASLQNLAQVHAVQGVLDRALRRSQEALALQEAAGNRWEQCNLRIALANTYQMLGDVDASLAQAAEGLALADELGDEAARAFLLCNRGALLREAGRPEEARRDLEASLALAARLGATLLQGYGHGYLARLELDEGRPGEALRHAEAALRIHAEVDPAQLGADLVALAEARLALGDEAAAAARIDEALAALGSSAAAAAEYPHRDQLACARVLAALGRDAEAARAHERARSLLMARAARIEDERLRAAYLERIPEHRAILRA